MTVPCKIASEEVKTSCCAVMSLPVQAHSGLTTLVILLCSEEPLAGDIP